PLLAAILTAIIGRRLGARAHWPCVIGLGIAFLAAMWLVVDGWTASRYVLTGFNWITAGDLEVSINLRSDAMTDIMLATVTFVSLLVAIYSSEYMRGDPGYSRYFATVSLFVFSMCML